MLKVKVASKTLQRLQKSVPKFKKILQQARKRDINEANTVTIVTDMLEEIFGFDKYSEVSREYVIQKTYCDLAVKSGKGVEYLIEVKAIGLSLKASHLKQAVNYASREGVEWVILTNGIKWEIYKVTLDERVRHNKVIDFDFTQLDMRKLEDQESLFPLCKRGVKKEAMEEMYKFRQLVNKYTISAAMLSEPVIKAIKAVLKKAGAGMKIDNNTIEQVIKEQVLKLEIAESQEMKDMQKTLRKTSSKPPTPKKSKSKQDVAADPGAGVTTDTSTAEGDSNPHSWPESGSDESPTQ